MLPKLLAIAFLLGISACATTPRMTVYVSTPARGGMNFHDPRKGSGGFLPYDQTDKFVCFTPDDLGVLLDQCGR